MFYVLPLLMTVLVAAKQSKKVVPFMISFPDFRLESQIWQIRSLPSKSLFMKRKKSQNSSSGMQSLITSSHLKIKRFRKCLQRRLQNTEMTTIMQTIWLQRRMILIQMRLKNIQILATSVVRLAESVMAELLPSVPMQAREWELSLLQTEEMHLNRQQRAVALLIMQIKTALLLFSKLFPSFQQKKLPAAFFLIRK